MSNEPGEQFSELLEGTPEDLKTKRLSELLAEAFDPEKESMCFGELVDSLERHGIAISLVLLALPSALPIPAAGYSTVLSLPLFAIGSAIILGAEKVALPARVRALTYNPSKLQRPVRILLKLVRLVEKISKPRFTRVVNSKIFQIITGSLICLLAAFMFLPIPLTNTLPAGGIFLIGFGLLERDLLVLAAGMVFSVVAMALPIAVAIVGIEVVKAYLGMG